MFTLGNPDPLLSLPPEFIYIMAAVASATAVCTCLIVYLWNTKKLKLRSIDAKPFISASY
jgi:hypothetical protein